MKTIISASRRTDIPAFYYEWFQECLKNKEVTLNNPMYPEKQYTVDLKPENIHSIVLWSKDFKNVLNNPGYLKNYNLYFQYTITGYSKKVEPLVPSYEESLKTLESLLNIYPSKAFNIRFDPILICNEAEVHPTPENPFKARLNAFERLCKDLQELSMDDCRITVSYISLYKDTLQKLAKSGINIKNLSEKEQIQFMKEMVDIANSFNRKIYTCANDKFLNAGICVEKGHCIDGDILESLYGKCTKANDSSQRLECGCVKSRDIGGYLPCKHGCKYCYANAK